MAVAACLVALLAGCSFADKNSSMPKFLRQPSDQPAPQDPEPDVKEIVRTTTLFTTQPSAIAISRPRRLSAYRFDTCVKALARSVIDGETRAVTMLVIVERGRLADRRRATREDNCETETYEKIETTQ
jgi:hypothetical protein